VIRWEACKFGNSSGARARALLAKIQIEAAKLTLWYALREPRRQIKTAGADEFET